MNNSEKFRSWIVGLYSWGVTVFFGAILLDIVYARLIRNVGESFDPSTIFSQVSDFLLLIGATVVLLGITAAGISWKKKTALILLVASLGILAFEFIAPAFFSPILEASSSSANPFIGAVIRLSFSGLSSILAILGLTYFTRPGQTRSI